MVVCEGGGAVCACSGRELKIINFPILKPIGLDISRRRNVVGLDVDVDVLYRLTTQVL